jgi:hypothetical protein
MLSFNGDETQAAGNKIELMLYHADQRKYEFHEIVFDNNSAPIVKENPAICLSCHGTTPRPIWDHYNEWPGAYGSLDDKMSVEELSYLKKFMEAAPEHPRYSQLLKLKEGYRLLNETIGPDGHTRDRTIKNHNRELTIALYQQRYQAITHEMVQHPQFKAYKELIMFFLSKCYRNPSYNYNGDGGLIDSKRVEEHFTTIANKKAFYANSPFQIEQALDFIYTRLGVETESWYLNSRQLPTYHSLRDGTDRVHEALATYFLNYLPEWKDSFNLTNLDFQIDQIPLSTPKAGFCEEISPLAFQQAEMILNIKIPDDTTVVIPNPNCGGLFRPKCEKVVLPSICLKCHSQEQNTGKIYLPFQDLKTQVKKGNKVLTKRMLDYITINQAGRARMPRRTTGDDAQYRNYLKNDYPKLKKYLEDLLR